MARHWKRARPAALAALCGVVLSASAFAVAPPAERPAKESDTPRITFVPGRDGGHFRFAIKGKEVAILDETGLHVRGEINYGGMLTDYGRKGFEERAAKSRDEAHAE